MRLQLGQTRNMPKDIAVSQLMGGNFFNFCLDHILPLSLTTEILKLKYRPSRKKSST